MDYKDIPFHKSFPFFFPPQRGHVFLTTYLLLKRGFLLGKKNEMVKQLAVLRSAPTSLGKILVQFSRNTKGGDTVGSLYRSYVRK